MNGIRKAIKPWNGNGTPVYKDGQIVGELLIFAEWTHPGKRVYDNKETCWKLVKIDDIPDIVLDSEENIKVI